MKIGERQLHRIALFRQSGRIVNSEFYPTYNEAGIVESNEPVPFRLTRNLQAALSPTLLHGLFSATLMSANSCLLTHLEIVRNYMSLFLRDDLLSWTATKAPLDSDQRQRDVEKLHKDKVANNVQMVLKRIHMLMAQVYQQPTPQERAAVIAQAQARGEPVPQHIFSSQPLPVNHKVHLLIKVATSKQKLCTMGQQWAPWF
jgi:transformation/transcription domain-associated protein